MDINSSGSLSKNKFNEGLKALRSKEGVSPVEAHMTHLLAQLRMDGGVVTSRELSEAQESSDPLVVRLGRFFIKTFEHRRGRLAPDEESRRKWLEAMFPGSECKEGVSEETFLAALVRMRYPDWHVRDLFARLATDHSGELSLAEFTVALEPSGGKKLVRKLSCPVLDSESTERPGLRGHSTNLDVKGADMSRLPGHLHNFLNEGWCKELYGESMLPRDLPDHLATVRAALPRAGRSNLYRKGLHFLSHSAAPLSDLTVPSSGIETFEHPRRACREME